MIPSNVRKNKENTKCDKRTVTCDVSIAQCENDTIKCEKKINKGTTGCNKSTDTWCWYYIMWKKKRKKKDPPNMKYDKSTATCDVSIAQCKDTAIKCEKKMKEPLNVTKVQSYVIWYYTM